MYKYEGTFSLNTSSLVVELSRRRRNKNQCFCSKLQLLLERSFEVSLVLFIAFCLNNIICKIVVTVPRFSGTTDPERYMDFYLVRTLFTKTLFDHSIILKQIFDTL